MTLPLSGALKASELNTELSKGTGTLFKISNTEVRTLANKASGEVKFSDFYGKLYVPPAGSLRYALVRPVGSTVTQFGGRVAVDGDLLVVSGLAAQANVAAAYVYTLSSGTLISTIVIPSGSAGGSIGAIAISGNNVVIGIRNSTLGHVYIFDALSGTLLQNIVNTTVSPAGLDRFGVCVAIDGNFVAIGITDVTSINYARILIYAVDTGTLIRTITNQALLYYAPSSVSVSGDYVVLGGLPTYQSPTSVGGIAIVFKVSDGTLVRTLPKLNAAHVNDKHGGAVFIKGTWAVVGDTYYKAALLYDVVSGTRKSAPYCSGSIYANSAYSVCISNTKVSVGTPDWNGYGFVCIGTGPFTSLTALSPNLSKPATLKVGDYFGYAIANTDTLVAVGAYADNTAGALGRVFVFNI